MPDRGTSSSKNWATDAGAYLEGYRYTDASVRKHLQPALEAKSSQWQGNRSLVKIYTSFEEWPSVHISHRNIERIPFESLATKDASQHIFLNPELRSVLLREINTSLPNKDLIQFDKNVY